MPSPKSSAKSNPPLDRDNRIQDKSGTLERLGHIRSLGEYESDLATAIKAECLAEDAAYIESEHYEGRVDGGGVTDHGPIDVAKFLKVCKDRAIPQEKINSALQVIKKQITFLSEEDIIKCSQKGGAPVAYKLTVGPRKNIASPTLMEAIESIHIDAFNGKIPDRVEKKRAA